MANWRENRAVAIVAGAIFVIAMVCLASRLTHQPTLPAGLKAHIPATPVTTPYVK